MMLSGDSNEQRKTAERQRIIPLVYKVDRIKELIESGALKVLASKKPDNLSQQITKLVKKAQPDTTAYSLRHTLRHNAESAGIEGMIQAQLGGWSGKQAGVSEHMFKYGKGGADFEERIKPLAASMNRCLTHLLPAP